MLKDTFSIEHKTSPYSGSGFISRVNAVRWSFSLRDSADIFHVTGDTHFLVFGLPRQRTVLTIHDLGFLKRGTRTQRFLLWLLWVYLPVWWVKYVTCVSEETRREIIEFSKCNPNKVVVVHNFVKENLCFVPKEFNHECPVILHIGTFYNKNLERLIIALKGIPCHLRIVGKLSETAKNLLVIHGINYSTCFNISDEEVFREYVACDILSFCSTLEGFGLPIIEANKVGRPVVTSNISSMPEIAGEAACLVDPFNVESIRKGIRRVIEDTTYRTYLIAKGIENVKRFEATQISDSYANLYRSIGNAT